MGRKSEIEAMFHLVADYIEHTGLHYESYRHTSDTEENPCIIINPLNITGLILIYIETPETLEIRCNKPASIALSDPECFQKLHEILKDRTRYVLNGKYPKYES